MASVLVVDDEPAVLRLIETVLTRNGHKVVTASNGERAIEKARKQAEPFDLLLTDVVMPGLSGPMIADRLREQFPNLKILFMSAFEDRHVVRRFVTDPGYMLLAKPFQNQDLTAKVHDLLEPGSAAAGTDSGRDRGRAP